ncbi:uncharacterized protein LOC129603516 [Betta splendens]|uniref:Uncharacterized protein LOC129603516 n=1 Tax=Betta splendens TaxID=158456 RepID=A0A9W2XGK5_BETSP|nr:uncharacterized protein LOC129603516 [Betta splendens]
MIQPNPAALLCLHFVMSHVNTGSPVDYRDILVPKGDSVTLTCNTSKENSTQIMWKKDRFHFAYLFSNHANVSNFTSHRLIIDPHSPSVLNISNVQYEDAGLYTCDVTSATDGVKSIRWNLTVFEESEELSTYTPLWCSTLVAVVLLSGFILFVYIYRTKCRLRRQNQEPNQNQPNLQSDELLVSQPQRHRGHRNSCHYERINSLYNL